MMYHTCNIIVFLDRRWGGESNRGIDFGFSSCVRANALDVGSFARVCGGLEGCSPPRILLFSKGELGGWSPLKKAGGVDSQLHLFFVFY